MEKKEIEIYAHSSDGSVVRMPGRRFPGVVIEGDAMSIIYNFSKSILERVQEDADADLIAWAQELKDIVHSQLHTYEEAMSRHGLDLPYPGPLAKDVG